MIVDQDRADRVFLHRDPERLHWFDADGGEPADGDQFYEQKTAVGRQSHDSKVFLVPVDLVFPQEHLAHDGEDIIGIDDSGFFPFR